ncbi:FMN-dependent NADH-azoreductase [Chryseobacterium bernardetii]|uniref:FMN-dependent NADH-azoreductase n=2 Tax=Chryseobacterium TaxID=59732 RepID=A0ACC6J011_9FLAO|nr:MULTISPECIES: hypothetical protein [Chryseobacterium]MDR6371866.1 FMN-dependent NADH-azoreductase [Chryseobacterium vietnamense]MDR6443354.1 FMN-dependent NADH-azoreductase [Chryseobacterium bernardetii]MDR6460835.1 FMN-dependent NADH-azoreductase [Chryseobacterium vietnamense]
MKNILHVISSARGDLSYSIGLSSALSYTNSIVSEIREADIIVIGTLESCGTV